MSGTLAAALKTHRDLKGPRVLYSADSSGADRDALASWVRRAKRRAGLRVSGRLHIPVAHVLLAPRDARRHGEIHPGARRAPAPEHDAEVHAPVAGGTRVGYQAARRARRKS